MKRTRGIVLLPLLALAGTSLAARPRNDRAQELAKKIDAALAVEWQKEGVTPAAPATDLELLRRMTLDLLGTIPSLEEIRAFEAEPDATRREALPSRLLADPRFQAAMAERLARITVGPGRKPDDLFYRRRRYVEWLRDQVARHRPWDELVREIVAAEGITVDGPTNFVAAFDGDPVRLAGRTARAFLGIRLDCAQCHDHPFADWKQKDFEGLAAFFARTRRQGPLVRELPTGDYEIEDRKEGRLRLVGPDVPFAPEALTRTGKRRDALGRWLTDAKNPLFARAIANRIWAWLMGRGFIEPTDSIDEGKPRYPAVLALLEEELRANRFDLEELVRAIVSTRAYALSSRGPDSLVGTFAVAGLKPLHADQLASTLWQATSLTTEDDNRILPVRLARADQTSKFIARHGADPDAEVPDDETLLERLLLMNGHLVHERIKHDNPFGVTGRLLLLSPSDEKLVETAFLIALTRRPSSTELEHFTARLKTDRKLAAEDLLWALLNSSELAWNH
ncbi:MAG TPA: DUF1549 domain-containing protein [Planctomycetota bacterium]|nr:DUF1549 domain-containing protein [Planctomycetota bacterium]